MIFYDIHKSDAFNICIYIWLRLCLRLHSAITLWVLRHIHIYEWVRLKLLYNLYLSIIFGRIHIYNNDYVDWKKSLSAYCDCISFYCNQTYFCFIWIRFLFSFYIYIYKNKKKKKKNEKKKKKKKKSNYEKAMIISLNHCSFFLPFWNQYCWNWYCFGFGFSYYFPSFCYYFQL